MSFAGSSITDLRELIEQDSKESEAFQVRIE
jgi:hypothetical protein